MEERTNEYRYDRSVGISEALIDRQAWIDGAARPVQKGVRGLFDRFGGAGRAVENVLHGTPLGTPLHPLIVTVPIGAWTASLVMDAMEWRGRREVASGADTALGVGIVGAVLAAVTGITDWHSVGDFRLKRRVGFVHGTLNTVALGLYVGSWVMRRQGRRDGARLLALAGFSVSGASAHLGGALVHKEAQAVTHVVDVFPPDGFTRVASSADVVEGRPLRVTTGDVPVVLVRDGGRVYALAERCTHLGGPLSEGSVEDGAIRCPWHGSAFRLKDGQVLDGPSAHSQPCFEIRETDGAVEVRPGRHWA